MKEFSELTLQKINRTGEYYVYGLIDPRTDSLFYIGKGTENRVFQHVIESGKNPETEKAKLKIIKDIEASNSSVKQVLINWGLTESEAYAAEASLINLVDYISFGTLTNAVFGHHSSGCMTVEEIEREYGAEPLSLEDFKHKILIIKINQSYNRKMSEEEVYDIVRGNWRASMERAKQAEYVLGIYRNLVVSCYKPIRWYRVGECDISKIPRHQELSELWKVKNRIFFEADDIKSVDEVQKFYLYKSVENIEEIQRTQNPISYIGF